MLKLHGCCDSVFFVDVEQSDTREAQNIRDYSFRTFTKSFEKLTFLTS